eukprot:9269650-Pyramimonas_sp.AAC.1
MCNEFHGLRASGFQHVALASALLISVKQELQKLREFRASGFHNVILALTPRAFVLNIGKTSRIEGCSFSNCGSRLSAACTRSKHLQELQGLRAGGF